MADVTPPAGAVSVSSKSLYPYRDGYQDTVAVDLGVTNERVDAQLEVLDDEGQTVKKFHESQSLGEFTWDGRVSGGGYAPAGTYTFRATLTDDLGNAAVYEGGPVTVSSKKLGDPDLPEDGDRGGIHEGQVHRPVLGAEAACFGARLGGILRVLH